MMVHSAVGNWTYLRPVDRDDYPVLHAWRSDLDTLHLWSSIRRLVTLEEFVHEFEGMVRTTHTLMAVERQSEKAIGFVQAYGLDPIHRYALLLMFVEPAAWSRGYAIEVGLLFTRHLFYDFGLRKLYADIYEYNQPSIQLVRKLGFVEEGRRRHHAWYNDRYWDMLLFALYREEWDIRHARWNQLMRVRQDTEKVFEELQRRRRATAGSSRAGAAPEPGMAPLVERVHGE